jgi:hypothetical protein
MNVIISESTEISEIKKTFLDIQNMRTNIKTAFDAFELKTKLLKDVYLKYINENTNNNKSYNKSEKLLFGLDSLHFQNTLIDFEYNNLRNLYYLIDNKIYCEYYKLLKLINKYIISNTKLNEIISINTNKYPPYKDLEPFKVYEFNLINEIHDDIINLLNNVLNYCKAELENLNREKTNKINGLKLDNYINTIEYDIVIIKQNMNLYINYLNVFHTYHLTYLSRLNIKINIIWGQISSDIKLNSIEQLNEYDNELNNDCPSPLTNKEHNEIINIMKDNNISCVKSELENIMSCNSQTTNNDINDIVSNDENINIIINNENISDIISNDESINDILLETENINTNDIILENDDDNIYSISTSTSISKKKNKKKKKNTTNIHIINETII